MTVNFALLIVFTALMYKIGGARGISALCALAINIFIMFVSVILIRKGYSVLALTFITSLAISSINLFFINGVSKNTKVAFISSTFVTALLVGLLFFAVYKMHLQGLPLEELTEMDMYSLEIGTSYISISVAVLIMSVIGAVNDVAISITSAMDEVKRNAPELTNTQWYNSGITIGKDVLSATLNTLIFTIVGGQLAVLIWISDLNYSFVQLINSKLIVTEWVSLLISGISITLTVPITTKLMTYNRVEE